MAMSMIATVKGGTLEQYDRVSSKIIVADPPVGLLHHVCVPIDGGFMVIETWESEKALEAFTTSDLFRTEIAASGMPQPDMQIRKVHHMQTP